MFLERSHFLESPDPEGSPREMGEPAEAVTFSVGTYFDDLTTMVESANIYNGMDSAINSLRWKFKKGMGVPIFLFDNYSDKPVWVKDMTGSIYEIKPIRTSSENNQDTWERFLSPTSARGENVTPIGVCLNPIKNRVPQITHGAVPYNMVSNSIVVREIINPEALSTPHNPDTKNPEAIRRITGRDLFLYQSLKYNQDIENEKKMGRYHNNGVDPVTGLTNAVLDSVKLHSINRHYSLGRITVASREGGLSVSGTPYIIFGSKEDALNHKHWVEKAFDSKYQSLNKGLGLEIRIMGKASDQSTYYANINGRVIAIPTLKERPEGTKSEAMFTFRTGTESHEVEDVAVPLELALAEGYRGIVLYLSEVEAQRNMRGTPDENDEIRRLEYRIKIDTEKATLDRELIEKKAKVKRDEQELDRKLDEKKIAHKIEMDRLAAELEEQKRLLAAEKEKAQKEQRWQKAQERSSTIAKIVGLITTIAGAVYGIITFMARKKGFV